ncbi:unnamed protein product [Discosporangium mesarthrocarpum]
MCPLKSALTVAELKWSKRLESVRKYVECFFGRLKGWFRILQMPLTFWVSNANAREKTDNIFFACCLLQSMLHACNGLSVLESGTDWCGLEGIHEAFNCDPTTTDTTQVAMSGMRAHGGESGQRMEAEAGFCISGSLLPTTIANFQE